MSVLKSWFNTVEKNSVSSSVKIIRKLSNFVPKFTKYGLLSLICYSSWKLSEVYLVANVDAKTTTLFILLSVLCAYLSIRFGMFAGRKAEVALDSIYEQSYINFSSADDNFVKNSSSKIRASKIKALLSLGVTIVVGVGCSLLANWLGS